MTILSEQVVKEINDIVEKKLEETQTEITKAEISKIITEIIPEMDKMISERVKQHFVEIAEFIKEKFKS
jgi:histone H3/H4